MILSKVRLQRMAAFVLLIVGLALADRAFANWRNDIRNFPDQNGVFLPGDVDTPPQTFFQHHSMIAGMAISGVVLLVGSIVLFTLAPFEPDPDQERAFGPEVS